MKLYNSPQSPNARKVRLFAAELDLPLELINISLIKGEQRSPEYLNLNPNGRVPVLEDEGFLVWESAAILRYLANKRHGQPANLQAQAELDQWMFWWSAHPEAALMALTYEKLVKPVFERGSGNDPTIIAEAETTLKRFLPVLERKIGDHVYLLSNAAPSCLDFSVAAWLDLAESIGVSLARYPRLSAWLHRLHERPYWKTC